MSDYIPNGYRSLKDCFEEYGRQLFGDAWLTQKITDEEAELIGIRFFKSSSEILQHIAEHDSFRRRRDRRIPALKEKINVLNVMEQDVWTKLRHALFSGTLTASAIGFGEFTSVASVHWALIYYDTPEFTESSVSMFGGAPYLIEVDAFRRFLENDRLRKICPSDLREDRDADEKHDRPEKNKGGRPKMYDWLAIHVEIARHLFDPKLPKNQAELVKRIQAWYPAYLEAKGESHRPHEPTYSELKKAVSAFWKIITDKD